MMVWLMQKIAKSIIMEQPGRYVIELVQDLNGHIIAIDNLFASIPIACPCSNMAQEIY